MDFLPHIYKENWHLETAPPRVIASYETLIIPFDGWMWMFLLIALVGIIAVLLLVQQIWRCFLRGEEQYTKSHVSDGKFDYIT